MHWFNLLVWNYYFGFFLLFCYLLFLIFLQSRADFFLHYSCVLSSHEIFQKPHVFSTFPLSPLATSTLISYTVCFSFPAAAFPQQHSSLWAALRRAAPLACSRGKEERRGWVRLPRECCSTLCPSVPLYSAPFCSCKAEGRGTGNAACTSSNSGVSARKRDICRSC